MKYAVIGAGGMGVQYGVLLQEFAGKDVDFIDTWQENVEQIRAQHGVYVSQDEQGRHLVPIHIYYPEEYDGDPDVWIVFLKQMQLDEVLKRCSGLFRSHQYVFSAMNGYGHFEKIAQYVDPSHIFGGTALIGAEVYGPGDMNFTGGADAKAMNMCAYREENSDKDSAEVEQEIFRDFTAATLNPTIVSNFMGMCMAKIVFNSVLNTLCTMYQIRFGEFMRHPGARWMTEQLVDEAYTAAEQAGLTLLGTRESEVETICHTAGIAHPLHYPSMYQDLTKGRPTEVDYINGYIAKIGREHGYECRLHEFATQELHLAELAFGIHHPEFARTAQASAQAARN
ncbi:ketopantoate reductase family protein [Bifidobacterium crudilactis]|jgi:2-dehydropantoate 2-reductase|uniref:2-dehydropantoate 2-reductase n=1 Tax=Bifidobacterium crudilactis TaxID=327277 RepID=A0A971IDN4_9BIFI|nr:ketopantoate reductase family protein [Bifidobacterium crudilactis]MCI1868116.1 ketopantoate reductase family protein [Bifidobacterium crudilactis]MDN5971468.1 ketopantoate reductase family protein [Bifidobacterium crudilactis]MDN6001238.1 ketopantoate reductase family protein [Bifidobacterium crudilactis]MDN6208733.1 ketopantoate reductase family protein [Bifidobacterium crudilactis]MDN6458494.1 ketopantoate reductase family protein [Bifidobacterium crudilactis]